MVHNERLREALLELEALRARESRLVSEGHIALSVLTDLAKAPDRPSALHILITYLSELVGANGGTAIIQSADTLIRETDGHPLPQLPVNVFSKARNLVDISGNAAWEATTDKKARSILSLPMGPSAFVLWGLERAQFSTSHLTSAKHLCAISLDALAAVDIRTNNALLAAVIGGSSSGFAVADACAEDQPLIFVNTAFEALSGYTAQEALGQNCRFLNDEPSDSPELARLRKAVRSKTGGRFLLRNKRKSGEPFWNDLTLFPVRSANGTTTHLVATQTDASIRVMAEQDRDSTRRRMEDALAHTDDAFILLDDQEQIQFANQAVRKLFPASNIDWAVGTQFTDNWKAYLNHLPQSLVPQNTGFAGPSLQRLARRTSSLDLALPDGRVAMIRAKRTDTGGIVLSATDVTALKTAERQTRQRTAAIENAQDGIGISDAKGRMVYANPSLARLLGKDTPDDVLGLRWQRQYLPNEIAKILHAFDETGTAKGQLEARNGGAHHEISLTKVDGVGTVLVVQDVTDRLAAQAEQAATQKALDQARQREVLSDLAAGIAHDFNNILSAINGSAMLLETDPNLTPEMAQHTDRIARAGKSAAKLVNHMLDLSRTDADDGMYDLKWAVDEAMALSTAAASPRAQLSHKVAMASFPVFGVPNDAVQILVNLIMNASDALRDQPGQIAVRLDPVLTLPSEFAVGQPDPKGRYARLRVKDTGTGIPPEVQTRMFETQFSTKGAQGSGVGLSTAASAMNRIGGGIVVTSAPGSGTTFDLYWPLVSDTADVKDTAATVSLKGNVVLVVDDDQAVTDVLQSYLERLGAEVAVCHDPHIALEAVADDPDDWDFVITDYDMPGLSGGDLVDSIRNLPSQVPIFVVTALARRLSDPRISSETVTEVFAKPLNLSKLALAMAEVSNKRDPG